MKEFLVFSDSHGNFRSMSKVLAAHPDSKDVVFLGDGLSDIRYLRMAFPETRFLCVRGNCDFSDSDGKQKVPYELTLEVKGRRILLTHGHRFSVKSGTDSLLSHTISQNCSVALFGHTHKSTEVYDNSFGAPVWLCNPGSIGDNGSFGILWIDEKNVLFSVEKLIRCKKKRKEV